jgi:hypothetical protein
MAGEHAERIKQKTASTAKGRYFVLLYFMDINPLVKFVEPHEVISKPRKSAILNRQIPVLIELIFPGSNKMQVE